MSRGSTAARCDPVSQRGNRMGASLRLFYVHGIAVRVHFSFLLIVLWAAYLGFAGTGPGDGSLWLSIGFAEIFVLLLFVCVVLHELAHALTAQLFNVQVQDITLWPLGGVAANGCLSRPSPLCRVCHYRGRPCHEYLPNPCAGRCAAGLGWAADGPGPGNRAGKHHRAVWPMGRSQPAAFAGAPTT